MKQSSFPIILIAIGVFWFLSSTGLMPSTPVILAVLLIIAGIAVWLTDGMVKSSVVNGTMLIYSGAAIYAAHEYKYLKISHLISFGLILAGALMLLARHKSIPEKKQDTGSDEVF